MRRIPSIFGASNHIHRNIPNDAFMDLEEIRHHLPELLDLRELLLHLSYEDPEPEEPVVEGKCLLKEATETFVPIYFKVNLEFSDTYHGTHIEYPEGVKEKIQSLTLEDWSKMFKDFNNPCALAPQIKGDLICLPVPLNNCIPRSNYLYLENPIKDSLKIEERSILGNTVYNIEYVSFEKEYIYLCTQTSSGYSPDKVFNVFDLDIRVGCELYEGRGNSTYQYTGSKVKITLNTSGIDLDLTPVTFTKLVRNEE